MVTLRTALPDHLEWDALALSHGFVGFWAVAGAFGLLTGVIPGSYLDGSHFSTYTIPGLALGGLVGATSWLAAFNVWRRDDKALPSSLLAILALAGWFVVQLTEVGYISWMQPFFIAILGIQAALAARLHRHTTVRA